MNTTALPTVQQVVSEDPARSEAAPLSGNNRTESKAADPGVHHDDKHIDTINFEGPEVVQSLNDTFPEGGLQAWLVLTGAFLALFSTLGFMVSIGTIQEYLQTHQLQNYTARDVGWIPSVFVYLALGLGIWVGPLFDRYGPRWIAMFGSITYVIMIFLLADCEKYWHFLLCLGLLGGVAGAALTTTSLAVVSHWFKRKRGLAHGIAMVGSSFGGVTIS